MGLGRESEEQMPRAHGLLRDAAVRVRTSIRQIIVVAATSGEDGRRRMPDVEKILEDYQRCDEIPDWLENFCIDLMSSRIPLVGVKA